MKSVFKFASFVSALFVALFATSSFAQSAPFSASMADGAGSPFRLESANSGSCRSGFALNAAQIAEKVNLQFRQAAATAKFDPEGRLASFEFDGKRYEPQYDRGELMGYVVDGSRLLRVSLAGRDVPESSTAVVFKDANGMLLGSLSLRPEVVQAMPQGLLQPESVYTHESASAEMGRRHLVVMDSGRQKFTGDWDSTFKPCTVCDAEYAADLTLCGAGASAGASAAVGIGIAGCAGTFLVGCGASVVIGIAIGTATYEAILICIDWARLKHGQCRQSCT